jgi:hypothetical protein
MHGAFIVINMLLSSATDSSASICIYVGKHLDSMFKEWKI